MEAGKHVLKVTAYITQMIEGRKRLLVFLEQDYEQLGYQVPGGTVEPNEPLEQALIREVKEEANLDVSGEIRLLGEQTYFTDKLGHVTRYYYELTTQAPESFTHVVQSQDEDNGWIYHYAWVYLDELPGLYGYLGLELHRL